MTTEDKRSFIGEDVEHILNQIDKILDIYAILMKEYANPKYIIDPNIISAEDFKIMNTKL